MRLSSEWAVVRYAVGILAVAAACLLTWLGWPHLQSSPTPLFFAAVMLTAWWVGLGPALLVSALAALSVEYFFIPPFNAFVFSLDAVVRVVVFFAVAGLISSLNGRLQRAESEVREAHAGLEQRVAERTAALSDSNRVLEAEIVERRRAEAALREHEEQLRHSQKMEAFGQLAGGIAHDFNNLLTVILGRAQLLQARMGREHPLRGEIGTIHTTAIRAAALTRQLLAFSRKQVLQPKLLDLNAVVASMGSMLRPLIGEDIDLVITPGANLGRVRVDPGQIEQMIVNLVVNARDAMPTGGSVTIRTANVDAAATAEGLKPGGYILLEVADTGLGMDAATAARIFEPFFTTKPTGRGTGLGLSTVYGIVQQSGGHIDVDTAPGRGATFRVWLPRLEEPGEGARPRREAGASGGTETVLLVEDEIGVRELVRDVLVVNGYTLLEAGDPGEALEISERHRGPIHLLLTDLVMPQLSGADLAARLAVLRPQMKVLQMSGYAPPGFNPGPAFLSKPFTPDNLARKVRETLDAPVAR
ncbi:MAG: DUF4118 domain-containing protein [Candidatus Rokubacteria bacterium]|nr:DUF4118 domain-containing protein [Candidatus Rokubacteria bacterium]